MMAEDRPGLCENVCLDIKQQHVPSVPKATGLLVLILNIFLPGTGSILAGLQANSSSCVFIGVIQFFLFGLLFGWIWSIWWGVLIYNKSKYHEAVLLGISIYNQQ